MCQGWFQFIETNRKQPGVSCSILKTVWLKKEYFSAAKLDCSGSACDWLAADTKSVARMGDGESLWLSHGCLFNFIPESTKAGKSLQDHLVHPLTESHHFH